MLLLALAIAPGLAVCLLIYCAKSYDKAPLRYLLVSFFLGMLAVFPALLVQLIAGDTRERSTPHFILSYAFFAYVVIALGEEASKFLMLRVYGLSEKIV